MAKRTIQDVNIGDLVTLVSGSTSMTVVGIVYNQDGGRIHLDCAWGDYFANGDHIIKERRFPIEALIPKYSQAEMTEQAIEYLNSTR